jgi:hypothetical protein
VNGPEGQNGFDFLALYKLYPRKAGKADGLRHCKTRIKTIETYQKVQAAIEKMAAAWEGKDKDKCPYFSSFVYQKRWEDDELPLPRNFGEDRRYGPQRALDFDDYPEPGESNFEAP